MRTEVPVFKRCFCCVPLRRGILLWAYLKLIVFMFYTAAYVTIFIEFDSQNHDIIRSIVAFLVITTCFAINLLLIVAAHKKSNQLLQLSYRCELGAVALVVVALVLRLIFDLIRYWEYFSNYNPIVWKYFFMNNLTFGLYVCLQLYIVAAIRSEIIKLDNKHEFRYVNHTVDAECEYYENSPPADSATKMQENDAVELSSD